ncbi:MAG TPA: hypothetical protein VJV79_24410 [Polyangiaceae bacterium]|nr:hypothetical protein [Polyangiaceae bacterium]
MLTPGPVFAQSARVRETPRGLSGVSPEGIQPTRLRWHDSYLYWDHAVTANTLGVGQDYLTRNPLYEMTIGFRPRYYLVENERASISLRGDLGVVSERTNSDTTSKQGEWSATDFEFWGSFSYKLRESKSDLTELAIRVPRLLLPTSKVSYESGKILGLGVRVGAREEIVLAGRGARFFSSVELLGKIDYGYLFSNGQVPINGALERIRMGSDGRSIVSDQLGGATLAQHAAAFGIAAWAHVHQRVNWITSFELRSAWKYPVSHDVQICGVVLTGCTQASGVAEPQTRTALTYFQTEIWGRLTDTLELTFGYANLATQLAPDGRRRNFFYSPDARFYLTLNVYLDHLYVGLSPSKRQAASVANEPRNP